MDSTVTEIPQTTCLDIIEIFAPIIAATIVLVGLLLREAWIERREKKAALLKTKRDLLTQFFNTVEGMPNFVNASGYYKEYGRAWDILTRSSHKEKLLKTANKKTQSDLEKADKIKWENYQLIFEARRRFQEASVEEYNKLRSLTALIGIYDEQAGFQAHVYHQLSTAIAYKLNDMTDDYLEEDGKHGQKACERSKEYSIEQLGEELKECREKLKKFIQ